MKNKSSVFSLILIASIVGIYQINLVQQKLTQYGVENNIATILPYGVTAQTYVEDQKITLLTLDFKTKEDILPLTTTKTIPELVVTPNVQTVDVIHKEIPDTPNTPDTASIQEPVKCKDKCIVLMIGDSVMGDVYYSLSRKLSKAHPDWKIIDAHKVSSGLSKSSYYNWLEVSKKLVKQTSPDYTLILLGMNDAQSIEDVNKIYAFNTQGWKDTYVEKTKQIFSIINFNHNSIWIELPPVKEPAFDRRLSVIRGIHKEIADKNYFSTEALIGNNQNKSFFKYRQNDGIHLNSLGADMIASDIVTKILN